MESLPLASVKARFSELVDRVAGQQDRVTITRNGRPAAVLVSPDDLAGLEETLAVLSDPHLLEQLRAGDAAIAVGDSVDLDTLAATIGARDQTTRDAATCVLTQREGDMAGPNKRTVTPHQEGWSVEKPGASRASSVHRTQQEAINAARQTLANSGGGELAVKGRDGKVRDQDTVHPGNDPRRSRG